MRALLALFLLLLPGASFGQEAGLVEAIQFEGLRRVEAPAVKLVLSSRQGKPFSRANVAEDIRAIYGMGYFDDVQVFKWAEICHKQSKIR